MSNPEDSLQRIVLRDAEAVLPDRIIRADLVIEGTVIAKLAPPGSATGDEIWDLGGRRVTPGCIDAHIHGVNGTDSREPMPKRSQRVPKTLRRWESPPSTRPSSPVPSRRWSLR